MKDPHDTLTGDLFGAPLEFEGISHALYVDHENEVVTIIEHRTNQARVYYDLAARLFWEGYVNELKRNGFNADDALQTLCDNENEWEAA